MVKKRGSDYLTQALIDEGATEKVARKWSEVLDLAIGGVDKDGFPSAGFDHVEHCAAKRKAVHLALRREGFPEAARLVWAEDEDTDAELYDQIFNGMAVRSYKRQLGAL